MMLVARSTLWCTVTQPILALATTRPLLSLLSLRSVAVLVVLVVLAISTMQVHLEIFAREVDTPSLLIDLDVPVVSDIQDKSIKDLKKLVEKESGIASDKQVFILTAFNVWGEGEFTAQQFVQDTWLMKDLGPQGPLRIIPYQDAVGFEDQVTFYFNVFCIGDYTHLPLTKSRRTEYLVSLAYEPPDRQHYLKRVHSTVSLQSVRSSDEEGDGVKASAASSSDGVSSALPVYKSPKRNDESERAEKHVEERVEDPTSTPMNTSRSTDGHTEEHVEDIFAPVEDAQDHA